MKTSKITKIISLLVIIAALALSFNMVFATVTVPKASPVDDAGFNSTISNVLGVVTIVCYAAAVILLITLGVKWLIAAPDAKADLKKSAIYYVIGAIMIFAAGAIVDVIRNLGKSVVATNS